MKSVILTISYCLRSLIFYPLLFLREPFLFLCKFFIGITFIAFIFMLIFDAPRNMTIFLGCSSFILFLLSFFYDLLLLKLNPTNIELTLNR